MKGIEPGKVREKGDIVVRPMDVGKQASCKLLAALKEFFRAAENNPEKNNKSRRTPISPVSSWVGIPGLFFLLPSRYPEKHT